MTTGGAKLNKQKDPTLTFIISQPRSGSTLLQAILGSHPEVYTCSEPWIALPFIYALKEEGSEFDFHGKLSKHAIRAFFQESGIDEDFFNSKLNSFLTSLYYKALTNNNKRIFIDKTPRYYEVASDLIKIFPKAKFIVIYRHPLAVLNSILNTWVKQDIEKLFFYSRDLLIGPKKLSTFASEHHDRICLVKYEEIVRSPEIQIKNICEYIGIDYLSEIINYNSNVNWTYGDKNFKEKKVPDIISIDSWKTQLTDKRTANFSHYYLKELGEDIFNTLGYDFSSALEEIIKFHPNNNDLKTWKALLNVQHVVPVEEQMLRAKGSIRRNYLKILYRKLIP